MPKVEIELTKLEASQIFELRGYDALLPTHVKAMIGEMLQEATRKPTMDSPSRAQRSAPPIPSTVAVTVDHGVVG
jgi:hypothetical protein